jgi:hypothetical protein
LFEKVAEARLKKYQDWEDAPGPHDIMQAPGMSDMLDIYGSAESLANKKKLGGNPAMALSEGGNANYATQLDEFNKQNRYDERAAGLSSGLQSTRAEAYGLGGSAAELEMNRKNAYAQGMMQNEQNYYNRPKKQNPWLTALKIGVGGLSAI